MYSKGGWFYCAGAAIGYGAMPEMVDAARCCIDRRYYDGDSILLVLERGNEYVLLTLYGCSLFIKDERF